MTIASADLGHIASPDGSNRSLSTKRLKELIIGSVSRTRGSILLIFVGVLAIGLASRVRPWDSRAYYSGDFMPWWPTRDLYLWDVSLWTDQDGGAPSGLGGSVLAWACRWVALRVGFGVSGLDGVAYALPPAVGAAGVVLLLRTLGVVGAGTTLAAAHYAFNLEWVLNWADSPQWLRAMVPWLAWGVVWLNQSVGKPHSVRAAFSFAVLVVASASAGSVNLPQVVVAVVIVMCWLLARTAWDLRCASNRWSWLWQWARAWVTCGGFIAALGGWLVVWNIFAWLMPVLGAGGGAVTAPTSVEAWGWTHANASFGNLFIGLGSWGWREEYFGLTYLLTNSVPGRLLIAVPFIIALLAQFAVPKSWVKIATLALLAVLFIMKGVHEPFGNINRIIHDNVPGMQLLREPLGKLGFAWLLINSLLLAAALQIPDRSKLAHFSWRNVGLMVAWASVVFTALLRVREVRDAPTLVMPGAWVEIPSDWYRARSFIAQNRTDSWGRTLVLPKNDFYAVPYVWGGYFSDGIAQRVLGLWQVQSVQGYVSSNPASARATAALFAALAGPEIVCDGITSASETLGVGSALLRYDIGSRSARPLGSGPAQVSELARASEVLGGCGWIEIFRNESLQLLTGPTTGPRPVGATGATVDSRSDGPSAISGTLTAAAASDGQAPLPVATTLPSGYGFALLECGVGGDCNVWAIARAWFGGRFEWCKSRGIGEWCDFPTVGLSPGVYVVRNAIEDVYYVLLMVAAVTVVGGTTWAVWPWAGELISYVTRPAPITERQ